MQHYLMMTNLMIVAVANIQQQRLQQKRDIVVVDVCEDDRDDSLDDDDDGVDNLYKKVGQRRRGTKSELFGDGVHAYYLMTVPSA